MILSYRSITTLPVKDGSVHVACFPKTPCMLERTILVQNAINYMWHILDECVSLMWDADKKTTVVTADRRIRFEADIDLAIGRMINSGRI